MKNISSRAYDYAIKLGMSPSLKGFHMFVQAVTVYASSQELLTLEDVCEMIGKRYSERFNTVEHAISYAITHADDLVAKSYKHLGVKIQLTDIRPKYVICLVANNIKRDLEELA